MLTLRRIGWLPGSLIVAALLAGGSGWGTVPEPCRTSDPWPENEQVCSWQLDHVPSDCSVTVGSSVDWTAPSNEELYHCRRQLSGTLKCAERRNIPCQALVRRFYTGTVLRESTCDLDTGYCLDRPNSSTVCVFVSRDIVVYQATISDTICAKPSKITPQSSNEVHPSEPEAIP